MLSKESIKVRIREIEHMLRQESTDERQEIYLEGQLIALKDVLYGRQILK